MRCQSHVGTWNREFHITVKRIQIQKTKILKESGKANAICKDSVVCILALKVEESIVANYPEIYKAKEKSTWYFSQTTEERRQATQLRSVF